VGQMLQLLFIKSGNTVSVEFIRTVEIQFSEATGEALHEFDYPLLFADEIIKDMQFSQMFQLFDEAKKLRWL
jgi:hypothetical protein